jgi:hypothetical protein
MKPRLIKVCDRFTGDGAINVSRWVPAGALFGVFVIAGLAAICSDRESTRSWLIGAAFSGLAGALVDGITVSDTVRRGRPLMRIAARHYHRAIQHLHLIVGTAFDTQGDWATWPDQLRAIPAGPLDTAALANVYPATTKQDWMVLQYRRLEREVELLIPSAPLS